MVENLSREQRQDPIGDARNTVNLNDDYKVELTLSKDGYMYYGFVDVYLENTITSSGFYKFRMILNLF